MSNGRRSSKRATIGSSLLNVYSQWLPRKRFRWQSRNPFESSLTPRASAFCHTATPCGRCRLCLLRREACHEAAPGAQWQLEDLLAPDAALLNGYGRAIALVADH